MSVGRIKFPAIVLLACLWPIGGAGAPNTGTGQLRGNVGQGAIASHHIAAWGDSITASINITTCDQPDWPCGLVNHTATDFGVAGEEVDEGTVLLDAALDAGTVDGDFVSLAWGTNDLQDAVYPVGALVCDDVEVCFIAHLRDSGKKALDQGIVPILFVPIPWRIELPVWDDVGGWVVGVLYVTAGGTRTYINNTLRPALIALGVELGAYDPPGPLTAIGRTVPLVDAFGTFVSFGETNLPLYYMYGHGIGADNGVHPTWLIHPVGPNGKTGAQVIADMVTREVNEFLVTH